MNPFRLWAIITMLALAAELAWQLYRFVSRPKGTAGSSRAVAGQLTASRET